MGCHGRVESERAAAYEMGWLVRRNGVRAPSEVPIWSPVLGAWFLLDDTGWRRACVV